MLLLVDRKRFCCLVFAIQCQIVSYNCGVVSNGVIKYACHPLGYHQTISDLSQLAFWHLRIEG